MILEGPNIKDQSSEAMTPAALSIAQLFKYQSRPTHRRKQKDAVQYVRHNTDQETPLPIYVGLMLQFMGLGPEGDQNCPRAQNFIYYI